jgi:hypothetical protein
VRHHIQTFVALATIAAAACGGGTPTSPTAVATSPAPAPTAPAPPTPAPAPSQPVTMSLALRFTPLSAVSSQDVAPSGPVEQRRGVIIYVDVGAQNGAINQATVACTGVRGTSTIGLDPWEVLDVQVNQVTTVQRAITLITESPLRDVPLTFTCEARGTAGGIAITRQVTEVVPPSTMAPIAFPACVPSTRVVCLQGGRFQASVVFIAPDGVERDASVVAAPANDRGSFWFFDARQTELTIQVLNQCAVNQRYWVFAGGLTPYGVRATVTDTQTGVRKNYVNPQNQEAREYRDQDAFSTCPPASPPP